MAEITKINIKGVEYDLPSGGGGGTTTKTINVSPLETPPTTINIFSIFNIEDRIEGYFQCDDKVVDIENTILNFGGMLLNYNKPYKAFELNDEGEIVYLYTVFFVYNDIQYGCMLTDPIPFIEVSKQTINEADKAIMFSLLEQNLFFFFTPSADLVRPTFSPFIGIPTLGIVSNSPFYDVSLVNGKDATIIGLAYLGVYLHDDMTITTAANKLTE